MGNADNSILKSTGIMTLATLLSRVSGLLRTLAMSFALGNTLLASAYQIANTMPNFIYDLVVGGILGVAFLPIYLLQKEKFGREGADRFASNILNIILVLLSALAILAVLFASFVIFTQTFTRSDIDIINEASVFFFRIFAIQLVFYGLSGVVTGVLNAHRVYGVPALAPVFNNICVIVSMLSYAFLMGTNEHLALIILAVGTSLGVFVQFAIQIPTLMKIGFKYTPRIDLKDPALKEALKIAVPTLIYIVGTLVSFSCRNAFSLHSGDNGPATLQYAWMWYQLPYGVVAVSLSTTYLTEMSKAVARDDFSALRAYVQQGLRRTLFFIIPLAGMMFVLAAPVIQLQRMGAFSQDDVAFVSRILAFWVLSLPFFAGQMYLYRVFAALRQFMIFALVSCGVCILQIVLYAFLSLPSALGIIGIMVADFVYYGLMFATMSVILKKRIGSFEMGGIVAMSAKVIFATIVGSALVYGVLVVVPFQPSIFIGLFEIIVCGSLGLGVIFALSKILRVEEMDIVTNIFEKISDKITHRLLNGLINEEVKIYENAKISENVKSNEHAKMSEPVKTSEPVKNKARAKAPLLSADEAERADKVAQVADKVVSADEAVSAVPVDKVVPVAPVVPVDKVAPVVPADKSKKRSQRRKSSREKIGKHAEIDQVEPEVIESEQDEPEVVEPEVVEVEADVVEQDEAEVVEVEQDEPEEAEPEQDEPEVTEPEVTEPEEDEPEVGEFDLEVPEMVAPKKSKPQSGKSAKKKSKRDKPNSVESDSVVPKLVLPELILSEDAEPEQVESGQVELEQVESEQDDSEPTVAELVLPEVVVSDSDEPDAAEPEQDEPDEVESEVVEPRQDESEQDKSDEPSPAPLNYRARRNASKPRHAAKEKR
ncbi:MAG: murein biosynthesis integral membrane protein MurJ [Eggerthellaceae bacterium]|nr:murein biosynthesis integral membrane protein MurJ [Eggerthellaceae bacterium]